MGSGNTWWRAMIAIVVVVALPALATPKVTTAVNDWLYGTGKSVLPPMPELKVLAEGEESLDSQTDSGNKSTAFSEDEALNRAVGDLPPGENSKIQKLGFVEMDPLAGNTAEIDADPKSLSPVAPPLLFPLDKNNPTSSSTPNQDPLQRVREIKDELAAWGAEYILLESIDGGTQFRFCCLMADLGEAGQSAKTFPFESTAPDAAVAAESVHSAVQSWLKRQRTVP